MQTSVSLVVASWLVLHVVLYRTATAAGTSYVDGVTNFRIRSQNLHVDDLEKQLDKLESELNEWNEPSAKEVTQVKGRIQRLEKSACQPNELSCGGEVPQCVSHLLVCDGIQDCVSGHDECQTTCGGRLIKPGSSFSGVGKSEAGLILFNRQFTVTIQTLNRSPIFPSHAIVKGFFSGEYEDQVYLSTFEGRFVYATRRLEVSFVDLLTNHIVVDCVFVEGDDDHLRCKSYTEAAKAKLSAFVLKRV